MVRAFYRRRVILRAVETVVSVTYVEGAIPSGMESACLDSLDVRGLQRLLGQMATRTPHRPEERAGRRGIQAQIMLGDCLVAQSDPTRALHQPSSLGSPEKFLRFCNRSRCLSRRESHFWPQ